MIANDLVDAYRLMVYPIVLDAGKRLCRDGTAGPRLKLTDSFSTKGGVLILTYVPAVTDV